MKKLRLCLFAVFPVLLAQTPPPAAPALPAGPTEEQQAKMIADIREAALSWESKLVDFTCNRMGRLEARSIETAKTPAKSASPKADSKIGARPSADGRGGAGSAVAPQFILGPWQTLQMAEDKVTYSDRAASYSTGRGDGAEGRGDAGQGPAPVAPGKNAPKAPAAPLLEPARIEAFSDLLKGIFSGNAHTEFTWKGMVVLHNLPTYEFEYKVAKENSTQELIAGNSRLTVGYHGEILADRATHRVLTVSLLADVPPDFPEQDVDRVFDFGEVVLTGQFNLLPIKCQMQARAGLNLLNLSGGEKAGGKSQQVVARMTTDFLAYHRYTGRETAPRQQ